MATTISESMINAALQLSADVERIEFSCPVVSVYNPLDYAWESHKKYLKKWANSSRIILFMGMNPGPFGMAQTGIPFGDVAHVRDWIGISEVIRKPLNEHPKRPIEGFNCRRSEVSGRRLWGFFKEQFGCPEYFFKSHFVFNYCPLVFIEASGKNFTPDKLTNSEAKSLFSLCDQHLRLIAEILEIKYLVAVGAFAETRARKALGENSAIKVVRILHPSPASPLANKGWGAKALEQLKENNIFL